MGNLAAVGQPLVWNAACVDLEEIVGRTYDARHYGHLLWERGYKKPCPRDIESHRMLMDTFMENLDAAPADRGAQLLDIVRRRDIPVEDGYLHSTFGICADGTIVLLTRHGSLIEIAKELQSLGVVRAVLLDNGGSCGYALCHEGHTTWHIGGGTYFRPRGLAVFVAVLTEAYVPAPFVMRCSENRSCPHRHEDCQI